MHITSSLQISYFLNVLDRIVFTLNMYMSKILYTSKYKYYLTTYFDFVQIVRHYHV